MNVKPEPSILAWMVLNNPAGGGKTKTDITLRHVGENRKFVEASVSNNLPKDKYFAELAKRLEDLRVRAAVTPKRK